MPVEEQVRDLADSGFDSASCPIRMVSSLTRTDTRLRRKPGTVRAIVDHSPKGRAVEIPDSDDFIGFRATSGD